MKRKFRDIRDTGCINMHKAKARSSGAPTMGMEFVKITEVLMCVFSAVPAGRGGQEGGERTCVPAQVLGRACTQVHRPTGISATPKLGSRALLSPSELSGCGWFRSACTQLNYSEELITQSFS